MYGNKEILKYIEKHDRFPLSRRKWKVLMPNRSYLLIVVRMSCISQIHLAIYNINYNIMENTDLFEPNSDYF